MASQLYTVRNTRNNRYQVDAMNARRSLLPQMIANKNRKEDILRQENQYNQSYNLQKKQQKLANRQAKVGMGIEAAKMGLNVAQNFGGKTLGGSGGIFSGLGGKAGGINVGSGAAGLLGGFGASQLVKKGKMKKAGVGMLAGGLMGALGGGAGGAVSGGIGGLIGGSLGGFFK